MTRTMHDSFTKEWMQELLGDFGEVEIEKQLAGEVRNIDLVFFPNPIATPPLEVLGLLGKMVAQPCLIEAFRNPVPEREICLCRSKRLDFEEDLRRSSISKKQKISQKERPFLWILTPTFSEHQQHEFCVKHKPQWGNGIYFLPNPDKTAIVVIHQLPQTLDTLWIRLLGRGQVQSAAIAELIALPTDHPYRRETIHHLSILQIHLKTRQNKTKDIREALMSLSILYAHWREEAVLEGKQEERRTLALKMLATGATIEFVSQITEYSTQELKRLQMPENT